MGAVVGTLIVIGVIIAWDYLAERRARGKQKEKPPPDSILESHLEQYIRDHFDTLFPGWQIFDDCPENVVHSSASRKPTGVRYRTNAGEIDILCIDRQGGLVVIELKREKADDIVAAQVDRYMAWVKRHLAQPEQRVSGLIIAGSFSSRLAYALSRRRGIRIWTYNWHLKFNKHPGRTAGHRESTLTS